MAENDNMEEDENYDRDYFLSAACQDWYDKVKEEKKSILKERGVNMAKVEERLPEFFERLNHTGWMCFTHEPIKANYNWVREFYANAVKTNFTRELVTTVRGKLVRFDSSTINNVYGLADADNSLYKAKFEEKGNRWLVDKLQNGHETDWFKFMTKVVSNDFTAEAKLWLSIICSRIIPSSHTTEVSSRGAVVAAILDNIPVDVGKLIAGEIEQVVLGHTSSLFFPSLITQLCQNAGVKEEPRDNWRNSDIPFYPLRFRGEGGAQEKKKPKVIPPSDVVAPSLGQLPDSTSEPGASSTPFMQLFTPVTPLQVGPSPMMYISSQVSTVDAHIRQLAAGILSSSQSSHMPTQGEHTIAGSSRTPTLEELAAEQTKIKELQANMDCRLAKMEEQQIKRDERAVKVEKKQKKFGERCSKFLNKILTEVNHMNGKERKPTAKDLRYPRTDSSSSSDSDSSD